MLISLRPVLHLTESSASLDFLKMSLDWIPCFIRLGQKFISLGPMLD